MHSVVTRRIDRILASEDGLASAAAERIVLDAGEVYFQRAFPHVFDANVVRHPHLEPDQLDGRLDRVRRELVAAGVGHLQLVFDPPPISSRLGVALEQRGFVRDPLLAMVLTGAPKRVAAPEIEVRAVGPEAPFGWYADILDEMTRHEPWYSRAVVREIVGSIASKAEAGALQLFVAVSRGIPLGTAGLALGHGAARGSAAIVGIGTRTQMRGRGVAQSMVVALADRARLAGCDLLYLVTRLLDTPQELYRKMGFGDQFCFDSFLSSRSL